MKIPNLDSFSERLPQLRARKTAISVAINKRMAECAIIRERIQSGKANSGSSGNSLDEDTINKLLGEVS